METYFPYEWQVCRTTQEDLPFDEFTSNYEDMIVAIISGTPDPRINETDYGDFD